MYTYIVRTIVRPSTRPPRTDDKPAKIMLKIYEEDTIVISTKNLINLNQMCEIKTYSNRTTEHFVMVTAVE